jgi:hypothetical protein
MRASIWLTAEDCALLSMAVRGMVAAIGRGGLEAEGAGEPVPEWVRVELRGLVKQADGLGRTFDQVARVLVTAAEAPVWPAVPVRAGSTGSRTVPAGWESVEGGGGSGGGDPQ